MSRAVEKSRFTHHVFVCQTQRPPLAKPSCGARGAGAVLLALQEAVLSRPGLASHVAVTPAGCMGPCFEGPTVVVYPDGVWYCNVTVEDVPEIVKEHLEGNRPVERLRYAWPVDTLTPIEEGPGKRQPKEA